MKSLKTIIVLSLAVVMTLNFSLLAKGNNSNNNLENSEKTLLSAIESTNLGLSVSSILILGELNSNNAVLPLMKILHNSENEESRIQEIEGFDPIKTAVNRSANYQVYYLQHSVPRFNNPSGVFDNDQYLYEIFVDPTDTAGIAAMNTMWDRISTQAVALGNVVLVETGL